MDAYRAAAILGVPDRLVVADGVAGRRGVGKVLLGLAR